MTSSLRRTGLVPSLLRSFDEKLLHAGPVAPSDGPPVVRAVDASLAPRGTLQSQRSLVRNLLLLDFVAAAVAGLAALLVRFGTGGPDVYLLVTLAAPLVWVLSCASVRAYEQRFLGTGSEEFERIFNAGVRLLASTAVSGRTGTALK